MSRRVGMRSVTDDAIYRLGATTAVLVICICFSCMCVRSRAQLDSYICEKSSRSKYFEVV